MSRIAKTKMSGLLLMQFGQRFFSTSSLGPVMREASTFSRPLGMEWVRIPMLEPRKFSNLASSAGKDEDKAAEPPSAAAGKMSGGGGGDEKAIVSYWGVAPPQFTKEDGSPWRWNCFRVCLELYIYIYIEATSLLFFFLIEYFFGVSFY